MESRKRETVKVVFHRWSLTRWLWVVAIRPTIPDCSRGVDYSDP